MAVPTLSNLELPHAQLGDLTLFRHEPLGDPSKQFRLVEFLPGRDEEVIQCKISTHSLAAPPEYHAASYEWGGSGSIEWIELNGHAFRIRSNLWRFLRRLRMLKLADSSRGFFIDAISIDQDTHEERNAQVQIMAEIYAQAKDVHAWLGMAADNSDSLLALCVSDYIDDLERALNALENEQTYHGNILPSAKHADWLEPSLALFSRTYWDRLWIIQEILLAQDIIVYCGSLVLPWRVLEMLARTFLMLVPEVDREHRQDPGIFKVFDDDKKKMLSQRFMHIVNLRLNRKSSIPLVILLDVFGEAKCRDVHDKIYGFMGLAEEFKKGETIKVDYTQSIEVLFFEVLKFCDPTQHLVFAKRLYDILSFEQHSLMLRAVAERYDLNTLQKPVNNGNLQVEVARLGTIRNQRMPYYEYDSDIRDDKRYLVFDMKDHWWESKLRRHRTISNGRLSLNAARFFSLSSVKKGDMVCWIVNTRFGMIYRRDTRTKRWFQHERPGYHLVCGTTVSTDYKRDDERPKDLVECLEICDAIVGNAETLRLTLPPTLLNVRAMDFVRLLDGFSSRTILQWTIDERQNNLALMYSELWMLASARWIWSRQYGQEMTAAKDSSKLLS